MSSVAEPRAVETHSRNGSWQSSFNGPRPEREQAEHGERQSQAQAGFAEDKPCNDVDPQHVQWRPVSALQGEQDPLWLSSYGSALHGSGRCRPCGWFWKAQGCANGKECLHCHSCPPGEIKARKRAKANGTPERLRSSTPTGVEASSEAGELGPWGDGGGPALSTLPSVGSALHALGECRPCAWFWKPQGCANGEACGHCHLCKVDAIKARKKARSAAKRRADDQDHRTRPSAAELPLAPPPAPPPQSVPTGLAEAAAETMAVAAFVAASSSSLPECPGQLWPADSSEEHATAAAADLDAPRGAVVGVEELPRPTDADVLSEDAAAAPQLSLGSLLHGTGDCRPCAWFWKKQGCANGRTCLHCHLCPKSELRARRKAREKERRGSQAGEDFNAFAGQHATQVPEYEEVDIDILHEAPPQKVFIPEVWDFVSQEKIPQLLPVRADGLLAEGRFFGLDRAPTEHIQTRSSTIAPPPGLADFAGPARTLLEQLRPLSQAPYQSPKTRSMPRGVDTSDIAATSGGAAATTAPAARTAALGFGSLVFAGA